MKKFLSGVAVAVLLGAAPAQAASVYIPGVTAQAVLSTFTRNAEKGGWRLTQSDSRSLAFDTPVDATLRSATAEAGLDPIAIVAAAEIDSGVMVKLTAGIYSHARHVIDYQTDDATEAGLQGILDTLRTAMTAKRKGVR